MLQLLLKVKIYGFQRLYYIIVKFHCFVYGFDFYDNIYIRVAAPVTREKQIT